MYNQPIESDTESQICSKCKKFTFDRVEIPRLEIYYKKTGRIIANDLFDSVFCKNCFIIVVNNLFDELQQNIAKKR